VNIAKLYATLTLNAIPTCKVTMKYPIGSLGGHWNEDKGLDAILACKFILK
jgi:hypothetical protein